MRRKSNFKRCFFVFLCFVLCLAIIFGGIFLKIKPLVFTYAKSYAETLFLNETNRAVVKILEENGISYSNMAALSRNSEGAVTSLEIDIEKINLLKSLIAYKFRILRFENSYRYTAWQ